MAQITTPRILSGFIEHLPGAQLKFDEMRRIAEDIYKEFGFIPLDTPVMELSEILLAKGGGETEKQIYRLNKGDNDLSLRFDLTVPLARFVAQHYGELNFPFKRYHIGKVYRGERPQRGRFREFYQSDIDVVGDGALDIMNDAEMPAIIYKIFTKWGITRFRIRINNRKLLGGFYEQLGLGKLSADIMRTADKLEKIGPEKVKSILTGDLGIEGSKADEILAFMAHSGESADTLAFLETRRGQSELYDTGLDELKQVIEGVRAFGVPEENFGVDLTISRGLDYYTGTVYETTLLDYPEVGSPCSGGRYDNLASNYTEKQLPGVGISIGLSRLYWALCDMGLVDTESKRASADVLVIPMTDDRTAAISAAATLQSAGVKTQTYFEQKKFKARMNYANKLGVPFIVLIGEDEIAAGEVSLKDMRSGEQQRLKPEEAAKFVAEALANIESEAIVCEK